MTAAAAVRFTDRQWRALAELAAMLADALPEPGHEDPRPADGEISDNEGGVSDDQQQQDN